MKSLLAISAGALLLIAATFGVACNDDDNGGDTLTLEDYFALADELQNGVDAAFTEQEQDAEGPAADASGEEVAAFFRELTQASADILRDAETDFDALKQPAEVEDAHNRLVGAVGDAADALETNIEELPDSITLAELESGDEDFFSSPEIDAAFAALDAACVELQAIADDNAIDVDLNCEEE